MSMLLLLPAVAVGLRFFGFKRTYDWLGHISTRSISKSLSPEKTGMLARHVAAKVIRINRTLSLYQASCLPESLCLWWLLRRQGVAVVFRLGVRTITGPFESHAWVEYEGDVINDMEDVNQIFEPMDVPIVGSETKTR